MKFLFWIGLLFVLLLSACQSAPPPDTQAPQAVTPGASPIASPAATDTSIPEEPVPALTEEGYPAPTTQAAPPPANVPTGYPEPSEEVSWEQARSLILEGQVAEVTQFHSMKVILKLKDGRVVSTFEPAIDEVLAVIEECGEMCSDIVIATE
jgi:hypothetical protein